MKKTVLSLVAVVALGGGLSACGGAADAADAPTDATTEEFCDNVDDIEDAEDSGDARDLAEDWAETGTPEEIDGDAREGFELFTGVMQDADDSQQDLEDLGLDKSDQDKVATFFGEAAKICTPS